MTTIAEALAHFAVSMRTRAARRLPFASAHGI